MGPKRMPISERARLAVRTPITPETISAHFDGNPFRIGTNQFSLSNKSNFLGADLFAKVISNFASIFENAFIYIWAEEDKYGVTFVTLRAESAGDKFNLRTPSSNSNKHLLGRIEFKFDREDNQPIICDLRSPKGNHGGKMLVAMYNLAKELGMKTIAFRVENRKAKQFYSHMDFGRPTPGKPYWWEVIVT